MDDGSDKVVNGLENAFRKLKKSFQRKTNKTSFQVSQLQKQADRAAAVLAQMAQEEQEAAEQQQQQPQQPCLLLLSPQRKHMRLSHSSYSYYVWDCYPRVPQDLLP
mmetsp:Transcript_5819/g.7144  ORF Transcript_5819/g.7144 Transcript_5819/m.7144 type:complete len:106 (-) Transcript_5819:323-640(-)